MTTNKSLLHWNVVLVGAFKEHFNGFVNGKMYHEIGLIRVASGIMDILSIKRCSMNLVGIGLRVIWGDHVDGHWQVEAVHQGDVKVIL